MDREDFAHARPHWRAAADGIAGGLRQHDIKVRAIGAVRRVARESEFITGLPPAMLAEHDLGVECAVELRPGTDAAQRGLQGDPITRPNAPAFGGGRVHLNQGIRCTLAQGRHLPMLGFAEKQRFGTAEDQRVAIHEIGPGARAYQGFLECRQWFISVGSESGGVQLHLARWRRES
jgi:hypothetical protein